MGLDLLTKLTLLKNTLGVISVRGPEDVNHMHAIFTLLNQMIEEAKNDGKNPAE